MSCLISKLRGFGCASENQITEVFIFIAVIYSDLGSHSLSLQNARAIKYSMKYLLLGSRQLQMWWIKHSVAGIQGNARNSFLEYKGVLLSAWNQLNDGYTKSPIQREGWVVCVQHCPLMGGKDRCSLTEIIPLCVRAAPARSVPCKLGSFLLGVTSKWLCMAAQIC